MITKELSTRERRDLLRSVNGCFMVRHVLDQLSDCLRCFSNGLMWKLSSVTFLISIFVESEGDNVWKCPVNQYSACVQLEDMPEIMCQYQSKHFTLNEDLNLTLYEDDSNSPKVTEVKVVKWETRDQNDAVETGSFRSCFMCLTVKRKIVLMSLSARYVWMVASKKYPKCEMCNRVKIGPAFAYNQYLRQISAEDVNDYFEILTDKLGEQGSSSNGS